LDDVASTIWQALPPDCEACDAALKNRKSSMASSSKRRKLKVKAKLETSKSFLSFKR